MHIHQKKKHEIPSHPKPFLKWAGGKTQLLPELLKKAPQKYNQYIEPFIGGGALFFALNPDKAVIADSNPELINAYRQISRNAEEVIALLKTFKNTEKYYYKTRKIKFSDLEPAGAAARTIYLNRTCFNGLYRVNKSGHFNVPYGRYKNPQIVNEENLKAAAGLLERTSILCGDYKKILAKKARPGDFIFLDPPYLPVSKYADFKRYTKEQFYEEDHRDLAKEVFRLHQLGCHVILTNSNHPLVHELYKPFDIEVIGTKRNISSKGAARSGQDVIVTVPPRQRFNLRTVPPSLPQQIYKYPSTRFMGSKNKLLPEIWSVISQFSFDTAIDLFAGSGVVSYMLKSHGKTVMSNDYMAMSACLAKAMIENNHVTLPAAQAEKLLKRRAPVDGFVQKTFQGLYFTDKDNLQIDILRTNIKTLRNPYKRAIAMSALIRACMKKRPRGIFTYIGNRYDDGRKDLSMSFSRQFLEAIDSINDAVFDNGKKNMARHGDAMDFSAVNNSLVYIDPPYYSQHSDNEYVRRYHFVEGLARDWRGVKIQDDTITKKFKSYPTPFSSRKNAFEAFDSLFRRFRNNILVVSYSSNSQPTQDEMVELISRYKKHVDVVPVNYKYSFGNQKHKVGNNKNSVKEFIFVGH